LYGPQTGGAYSGNVYYAFTFTNVLFVPVTGLPPLNQAMQSFMLVFFEYCLDVTEWALFTLSTTLPSGYTLAQSSSASNCFMYEAAIYNTGGQPPGVSQTIPFQSYAAAGAVGCTSVVPTSQPCNP